MPPCTMPNSACPGHAPESSVYAVALLSPAVRPLHRQPDFILLASPVGDALIEAHYDVGAQSHLVHRRQFRREVVFTAVQVRAEADALVVDLAQRPPC